MIGRSWDVNPSAPQLNAETYSGVPLSGLRKGRLALLCLAYKGGKRGTFEGVDTKAHPAEMLPL